MKGRSDECFKDGDKLVISDTDRLAKLSPFRADASYTLEIAATVAGAMMVLYGAGSESWAAGIIGGSVGLWGGLRMERRSHWCEVRDRALQGR